ncbi:MAG: alpha/beta fold hydrolase [Moorea sp. SIO2B7]|nr:alpha/beta fold hydrolase [Moorena sp. SIO2B7]
MMQLFVKLILPIVGLGAIAYLFLCSALLLWQNRLIFFPSSVIENTPDDLGLAYEDVWIPIANDGGKIDHLHGWWINAPSQNNRVLLHLHGNAENIGSNLGKAQLFHLLGFNVLLIDYRGYGLSQGKFPTEAQVYHDAQMAWDYLIQRRGIKPQDIFVYGHSLGGAIAINLAVKNPEMAGLIVEGSFTSISDMVDHREVYALFPGNFLLHQQFDSINKIKSLQMPLLLIHGKDDDTVPARMSEVLFNAATVPKKLLIVPNAGHNDVASVGDEEYFVTVRDFCQSVVEEN